MAYIGTSPSNGVRRVHTYTATAGQTTFTGSSTEGVTLTYADTNYIDVFQNGVLLGSADYTSTSGTSVVLAQGASVSDLVVIVVYDVFSVADTVSKTSGGSFDSAVTMSSTLGVTGNATVGGTLGVTGASTLTGALSAKGGAVFNEDSADVDFRVESNGNANMLFVDGGNDKVGIGTASPSRALSTKSSSVTVGNFESTSSTAGFVSFSDANTTNDVTVRVGAVGDNLVLQSGGSERMRIVADGTLLWSSTVGVDSSNAGISFNNSTHPHINISGGSDTNSRHRIVFHNGNGVVGIISTNGSSTAYATSSDHRLKENVDYTFDATTRLKQLRPARFNFIADADTTVDGFLAHEVQTVVPEAITGTHNEVDDDGNAVMQGIDQSKLVPLLVKTIQELEARITALENGE